MIGFTVGAIMKYVSNRTLHGSAALAVALLFAADAQAESADATPAPPPAAANLAYADDGAQFSIIVTATRAPTLLLGSPASVSVVNRQQLEERKLVRLGDALADVPGLYVRGAATGSNFPGSGQAVISLRGIPRTPRTLVMLDGQPLNNALSGGVNVAGIPLESVEHVEIVRGPYSALYGGNAMGGAVNFITAGPEKPLAELRVGAGSQSTYGASLAFRRRLTDDLGITLSASWRDSDGYADSDYVIKRTSTGSSGTPVSGAVATTAPDGQRRYWVGTMGARPWWQGSAHLALHYSPTDATKLTAGVGWGQYRVGYSEPRSFIRDAAGNQVFTGSTVFNDGAPRRLVLAATDFFTATPSGERDLRAFARAEHRFEDGTVLTANLGTLRHRFRFTQAQAGVASYEGGAGELTDQPNHRVDLDLSLRKPFSPFWTLTGGAALTSSKMDRNTRVLSSWRDHDSAGAIKTAGIGKATNLALFLQSEHVLGSGFSLFAGGRFDHFETSGRVIDNGTSAFDETYDKRTFQQFSPKIALVWQSLPWLSLRTSFGQGFRPPALFDMYSRTVVPTSTAGAPSVILPAPDLKPEHVSSFEFGGEAMVPGGGAISFALYRQRLTDLIYRGMLNPEETLSRNQNASAASIDGLEAGVNWPIGSTGLKLFGQITHHFRYEITAADAAPATVGKLLTDVPQTSWSAGLEYARGPWTAFFTARHTSHVFGSGNDLNTNTVEGVYGSYDAHTVLSAKITRKIGSHLSVSLAGDNLTNRDYFVFAKQPGRSIYGELAWRF